MEFNGINPALITPYDKNFNVDYDAYARMLERLIKAGVQGVFATGSTGEFLMLSPEEKRELLKVTVDVCKGKINILAQIGNINTEDSYRMLEYAEKVGVDAVFSVPPIYYKHNPKDLIGYYEEICNRTSLPVFAYDIPALTGIEMLNADFYPLYYNAKFKGIKATSSDLYLQEKFKRLFPDKVLLHGFDETLAAALLIGADGAIGGTFSVIPSVFIKMYELSKKNDYVAMAELQHRINPILDGMIPFNHTVSAKYLLSLRGFGNGECRRPFRRLKEDEKDKLNKLNEYILNLEKSL